MMCFGSSSFLSPRTSILSRKSHLQRESYLISVIRSVTLEVSLPPDEGWMETRHFTRGPRHCAFTQLLLRLRAPDVRHLRLHLRGIIVVCPGSGVVKGRKGKGQSSLIH